MDAGVPTPVVFQSVERLAPTRLNAMSSTGAPALAKFEIWQNEPNFASRSTEAPVAAKFEIPENEPNFANIHRTKALNGDHRENPGLRAP
jgi:hypothetical protein